MSKQKIEQFEKVLDSLVQDDDWLKINVAARDKIVADKWFDLADDYLREKNKPPKKASSGRGRKKGKTDNENDEHSV